MLENGEDSSGKRTMHFSIRLFHATDLMNAKEATFKHCPVDRTWAEHDTKPLAGSEFEILGT